ncbi:MAG: VIT1/CCC1 transporter family protein [Candidatus Paceibacteria bacterium]
MGSKLLSASYIRNFVFGVEDSLVSTVGLLSGITVAGVSRQDLILTGVVLIFVEAFSMAVGSFLSEHSAEEFITHTEAPAKNALLGGSVMFLSYFIAGFIPLFPYLLIQVSIALWVSIALSLFTLFGLGISSAKLSRVHILEHGFRMFLIGGLAIAVGVVVGRLLR